LVLFGAQATRYCRKSEGKAIGRNVFTDPGPEEEKEVADPSKLYEESSKLSTMSISRSALIPIAEAALIPFAATRAVKLAFKEVFSLLKKLLLLGFYREKTSTQNITTTPAIRISWTAGQAARRDERIL